MENSKTKDAFSVLLSSSSSAKRKRTGCSSRKQGKPFQQSAYVPCPICTIQVRVELVSDHLDRSCNGSICPKSKKQETTNLKPHIPKNKTVPCSSTANDKMVECPACGKRLKLDNVSSHLDFECKGLDSHGNKHGSLRQAACGHSLEEGTEDSKGTKKSEEIKTTPNVFTQMMEVAKTKSRLEKFFLVEDDSGCFSWRWWVVHTGHNREMVGQQDNYQGTPIAVWTAEVPIKDHRIGEKGGRLEILSNRLVNAHFDFDIHRQRLSRFSVGVLKSMLQKNIRCGRVEASMRVAFELMAKSWDDFIRRILVIVFEDCALHPAVPLLAWLMLAASRGAPGPSPAALRACLRAVGELAAAPFRDTGEQEDSQGSNHLVPSDFDTFPCLQEAAVCRAMLLRAKYGGMACDQELLNSCALIWKRRFEAARREGGGAVTAAAAAGPEPRDRAGGDRSALSYLSSPFCMPVSLQQEEDSPILTHIHELYQVHCSSAHVGALAEKIVIDVQNPIISQSDAILSGIDFHVSSVIDDILKIPSLKAELQHFGGRMHPNSAEDSSSKECGSENNVTRLLDRMGKIKKTLKSVMWENSSSLNKRVLDIKFDQQLLLFSLESVPHCPPDEESTAIWSKVKKHVLRYQQQIVCSHVLSRKK